SFAHILGLGEDWRATAVCVPAAVALAVATYVLVERPLRRARRIGVPAALASVTLALCVAGVAVQRHVLAPRLDGLRPQAVSEAQADWTFPSGLERIHMPGVVYYRTPNDAPEKVLYFGDSNIQQYWPRIDHVLREAPAAKSVLF